MNQATPRKPDCLAAGVRALVGLERQIDEARAAFYMEQADIQGVQRALAVALDAFERRVDPRARDLRYWRVVGQGWFVLGRLERAERCLKRALQLAPGDGWATYHLGRIALQRSLR